MEKVVEVYPPRIAPGAIVSEPVLELGELKQHISRVKAYGTWKKGIAGHVSLPTYFNDDKTGITRPVLIQVSGHSLYGLGFYDMSDEEKKKREEEQKKKEEDDKRTGKKTRARKEAATMSFDYDLSPEIQELDVLLNAIVKVIVAEHLDVLKKTLSPGDNSVICSQRKAARPASGSIKKALRLSCYPGRVQCEIEAGGSTIKVAMKDFPFKEEGDYDALIEFTGIDASIKDGVLTYGPILYGKALKQAKTIERQPLKWREPREPAEQEISEEAEIVKKLKKVRKEEKKQKKEEEKQKKRKEVPKSDDEQ